MNEFNVGDVVICIDNKQNKTGMSLAPEFLKEGHHYVVLKVSNEGGVSFGLAGLPFGRDEAWAPERFRLAEAHTSHRHGASMWLSDELWDHKL